MSRSRETRRRLKDKRRRKRTAGRGPRAGRDTFVDRVVDRASALHVAATHVWESAWAGDGPDEWTGDPNFDPPAPPSIETFVDLVIEEERRR